MPGWAFGHSGWPKVFLAVGECLAANGPSCMENKMLLSTSSSHRQQLHPRSREPMGNRNTGTEQNRK